MDELKYPTGKFKIPKSMAASDCDRCIGEIGAAPAQLRAVDRKSVV